MGYLNRVWMVASEVVANSGHTEQGHKCQTGLTGIRSVQTGRKRFSSTTSSSSATSELPDFRPVSGMASSDSGGRFRSGAAGEERRKLAEESLRQVMYLSCWGQI